MTSFRVVATGVLALALLSGCGSDSDDSPDAGPADGPVDDGFAAIDPPTDDDGPDEPQPSGDAIDDGTGDGSDDAPGNGVADASDDSTNDGTDGGDSPADSPDDHGADPSNDATAGADDSADGASGDDTSGDDGPTGQDDSTDDGSADDGSPAGDDAVDSGPDGDADGGADQDTGDVAAQDLVNADNYLSLTEFAVRMNIGILADRSLSPTVFLGRFPPDVDALVESAREAMEAAFGSASISEACSLGGGYEASAGASPVSTSFRVTYDECTTDQGTLDGDYGVSNAPRERFEEYDLEYRQDDSANGPGTTVFDANYETGEFANVRFDVERYARDTPRDPFAVRGTGGSSLDLFSATNDRVYRASTTIWFESDGRSIDLSVSVNQLVLEEGRAKGGTISLAAQDGSRVDVSVPDASGTVSLTRTDRAGNAFPDTIAWSEIYRPPE